MSPLVYFVKQLSLKMGEVVQLSPKDKQDLLDYAREEMTVLGLEIK